MRGFGIAQFPVAVVGGDDGAGAHALLEIGAAFAAHRFCRRGQRLLHFGDRGKRDLGRQYRIEHMVVAQVGMGEYVVADALAFAQAAAVADHQPDFGTDHRKVVGDGLGVGRADADVDERDARLVRPDQVIGRHLMAPPGGVGQALAGIVHRAVEVEAAGAGKRGIAVGADLLARPVHELVHIAVVVGEQDVALAVLDAGACVMLQAREAEVGAQGVEQRQRQRFIGGLTEHAVRDLVADQGQFGGGEMGGQLLRGHVAHADAVEDVREGDLLPRRADLDRHFVVFVQQRQLFFEVVREKPRLGDRGDVCPHIVQAAERSAVERAALHTAVGDAQFRVAPCERLAAVGGREGAVLDKGGDVGLQSSDGGLVDADQFREGVFYRFHRPHLRDSYCSAIVGQARIEGGSLADQRERPPLRWERGPSISTVVTAKRKLRPLLRSRQRPLRPRFRRVRRSGRRLR